MLRRHRFLEPLVAGSPCGRLRLGRVAASPRPAAPAAPSFPPAGRRRRSHSSFPRGRNAHRLRRSARCRRRTISTSARWLIEATFGGAATLASARSKLSTLLNCSVSFWSLRTDDTLTPSGISNTKRTKVGCTRARTLTGGLFLAAATASLRAKRPLGGPRPRRQFANDFGGKRRRRTGPAIGQKIDEDPLARRHGIDGRPPRQRQPDRGAVGVAPRRTDIVRDGIRQFIDGNIHRALEVNDDDRTRGRHLGLDVLGKPEHQPGEAARGGKRRLAPHRIVGTAGLGKGQADEQQEKTQYTAKAMESPSAPMRGPATQFQWQPVAPSGKFSLASTIQRRSALACGLNLGSAGLRLC